MFSFTAIAITSVVFANASIAAAQPCSMQVHQNQLPAECRYSASIVDFIPAEVSWDISEKVKSRRVLVSQAVDGVLCAVVPCQYVPELKEIPFRYTIQQGFTWSVSGEATLSIKSSLVTRLVAKLGGSLTFSGGVSGSTVVTTAIEIPITETQCTDIEKIEYETKYVTTGTAWSTGEKFIWKLGDPCKHIEFTTTCGEYGAKGGAYGAFGYRLHTNVLPCQDCLEQGYTFANLDECCSCYVDH